MLLFWAMQVKFTYAAGFRYTLLSCMTILVIFISSLSLAQTVELGKNANRNSVTITSANLMTETDSTMFFYGNVHCTVLGYRAICDTAYMFIKGIDTIGRNNKHFKSITILKTVLKGNITIWGNNNTMVYGDSLFFDKQD